MRTVEIKHSLEINFEGDLWGRTHEKNPGWYVNWKGQWKGPYEQKEYAESAAREWEWELRYS